MKQDTALQFLSVSKPSWREFASADHRAKFEGKFKVGRQLTIKMFNPIENPGFTDFHIVN